ncbi:hypothetical protein DESUT3_33900 [Desulfuromonas versatilis]|uniref:Uncharacterized protein n=1 Tax=Desulfuromonas versatilis TaxID=2802975 RepID=A0ABM8HWD5_9BACT|nr:hypothetical protein [Desulfuromonas versatilis]BCR06321.1 hypothetical protein DESUT3_33900 [Desulfuromonas versatilis]
MYENKEQYETLVREKVVLLEWSLGHRIHHQDTGSCPRCGSWGQFDIQGLGFAAGIGNSIYYSTVYDEWRCRVCDYRMCA